MSRANLGRGRRVIRRGAVNADAMVIERQVRDIQGALRHVAAGAVIVPLTANLRIRLARVVGVTFLAFGAVIVDALLRVREAVRVVAGGAGERARFLITLALVQLLDVAGGRHLALVRKTEAD